MKALTITEPWATLIAVGAKSIETRSWPTSYRGPIAIHAAKGLPGDAVDFIRFDAPCHDAFNAAHIDPGTGREWSHIMTRLDWSSLSDCPSGRLMQGTRGCVIATADLIGCYRTEFVTAQCAISEQERHFGDYTPGRFAFRLANVERLSEPIPARGALSFWDWTPPADWEGRAA